VDHTSPDPDRFSLATKASPSPPPKVGWKDSPVVGKSGELVKPVT